MSTKFLMFLFFLSKAKEKIINHQKEKNDFLLQISDLKVRPEIRCFYENLAVNYFTFTALRSAEKFSNRQKILEFMKEKTKERSEEEEIKLQDLKVRLTTHAGHIECGQWAGL